MNVGQADSSAQFLTRTPAGPLHLTSTGAVWPGPGPRSAQPIRAHWIGSRSDAAAVGVEPRPERITYFRRHDTLHTRSYDRVRYHEIYPGIDLEYYRNNGEMEHDWIGVRFK